MDPRKAKKLTNTEFFTKKIDFCLMPTRNQNLQWAGGGGGTVPRGSKRISKLNSACPK